MMMVMMMMMLMMISTKTRMILMMMMMMMIAIFGSETKHLCGCVLLTMSSRYPSVPVELPPMPASSSARSPFEEKYFDECEAAKESANQQTVLHYRRLEIERFHLSCFVGFTVEARSFVAKNPWSLWATSYSCIADTWLRAKDYCRLGINNGFQSSELLLHLENLEDQCLTGLTAVCQPRQCASNVRLYRL